MFSTSFAITFDVVGVSYFNLISNKGRGSRAMPKIPSFYSRNPDLWFAMAESKFATAVPQITNDLTKFNYLVQALDEDTALMVKDLIMKRPKDA